MSTSMNMLCAFASSVFGVRAAYALWPIDGILSIVTGLAFLYVALGSIEDIFTDHHGRSSSRSNP